MKRINAFWLGFLLLAGRMATAETGAIITNMNASFEEPQDLYTNSAPVGDTGTVARTGGEKITWRFTKIVDTSTAIPNGIGNFTSFEGPSLDGGHVVFLGLSKDGKVGIYTDVNGLQVVADSSTAIPSGRGTFTDLGLSPSLDRGHVAFLGLGMAQQEGIYTNVEGLHVVADRETAIPDATGNFILFTNPLLEGRYVAFRGRGRGDQEGIYTDRNGLHVIADNNTPIPGGSGNFIYFGATLSLDGGHVAFRGLGEGGQQGIYTDVKGLRVVADTNTLIPGGGGEFLSFGDPSLDGSNVAFRGIGKRGRVIGIYTDINGLHLVVDTNSPIPGGTGKFFAFDEPSLDNGHVVFRGFGQNQQGIYTDMGGTLSVIIDLNTMLDGKSLANIFLGREGLCGTSVVFRAEFTDKTLGIYRADLVTSGTPPPRIQARR